MNDTQLKFIIKAVETGSFTKVAEYYDTTYQTVSYQIENYTMLLRKPHQYFIISPNSFMKKSTNVRI